MDKNIIDVGDSPNWIIEIWLFVVSLFVGLIAFLSNLALKDRDKRLDSYETWQKEHMSNHPNMDEILRMHNENREEYKAIRQATDNLAREIHELILRGSRGRKDDD